jgi:hypothetical protein
MNTANTEPTQSAQVMTIQGAAHLSPDFEVSWELD